MVTIETKKFGEESVTITFSARAGKFFGSLDGEDYEAQTLGELEEQLKRAAKRKSKQEPMPITLLAARWGADKNSRSKHIDLQTGTEERGNTIDGIWRGKNPRTRAHLLTIEGEKKSLETYRSGDTVIARRLTPAEHKQYAALSATVLAAEQDLETFVAGVKLDTDALLAGADNGE